jgi:hypothetical protein
VGEGAGTTIPIQFFRPREGYFNKISECYITLLKAGKRHFAPNFHYGLPEKMFVSISRHIKNIHGVWNDKKQGVRDENYLLDRNEQHYFFLKKT